MDYDKLLNALGDTQYLLTDTPKSVSVESVKLDKDGIEIVLERGIEEFAEDNALELAEEVFPAEDNCPACLVILATSEAFPVRVWQFIDAKEWGTE